MEKLRFTIRFIVLLAALPVIMFIELTRGGQEKAGQKKNTVEKVSVVGSEEAMVNHLPFMQAIYN